MNAMISIQDSSREKSSASPLLRICIQLVIWKVWVEDETTWIEIHGVDQRKYMLSIKVTILITSWVAKSFYSILFLFGSVFYRYQQSPTHPSYVV